jgi:hypothetical protein
MGRVWRILQKLHHQRPHKNSLDSVETVFFVLEKDVRGLEISLPLVRAENFQPLRHTRINYK